MDFDEYDYLEKTVEEQEDRDSKKKKKKEKESSEKGERSYRKLEVDENLDGEENKSKKTRGDEENGSKKDRDDRDRERPDREKERHRSGKERDEEGERERSNREKERDKGRDKDRERDRERRDKERERDGERGRERDKERERERVKREKEERERFRRSRSRSDREREREREPEIRDSRRFRDKKEAAEPEADPERDQRTVFAYQMPLKATERDVYEFFSKSGKVRDVRLIMDRNSRRSKGVGDMLTFSSHESDTSKETQLELSALEFFFPYTSLLYALYIEFYDAMSVPMAIALSGQLLLGQPVMVKPSEAEKNLVQPNASTGAAGVAGPYGAVDRKLYVGNLHFNMTESQLREIFEPFGPVELVQLPTDLETGHCKGFGFVQFAHLEHAKAAQSLNGKLEIAGRAIKISCVTDHVGSQDTNAKTADFDDDEGGLTLNAQSRALLMQKLDRSGIATSIGGSAGVPIVNGSFPAQQSVSLPSAPGLMPTPTPPTQIVPSTVVEPAGSPSECLLLKNMFDPTTETEPDFDIDIKEDVEEECSKFGRVKHIYVDKSAGFVYLRFESVEAASAAQRAMHMRWFARRLISAIFMEPGLYGARFKPEA